jgi:nucleotide-binding universal stress UspA family protein
MTIVCGTDLSENAREAARAASAIAKRLAVSLTLVHVVNELGGELTDGGERDASYDPVRRRLEEQANELRSGLGIEVEPVVVPGIAHETLVGIARARAASLIVVAALGVTKEHRWLLGSTAERVAQASTVPVLVVRDASSIEAWARGERTLRIMVGVELASTSKAALRWASGLRGVARCDLLVKQVAWPLGEHLRLGVPPPMPLDHLRPELLEPLTRDLRAWAGEVPGEGETTFSVSPGWGRVDTHLALLGAESKVDLLVVGAHQRPFAPRLWQGSVSRGVLHQSSGNVACVPRSDAYERGNDIPTWRSVLVPTDFSDLANRAIPVGYGLLASGGVVHLLHVLTGEPRERDGDASERLRALVPLGADARGMATEIEIVRDDKAWTAIWHAAGRLGVDAICMATHGRSGVSRVILGSQAEQVVQRARQPVILVPPEHDG